MCIFRSSLLAVSALAALLVCGSLARAEDSEHRSDSQEEETDRDDVRDLVREGKLMSLNTLRDQVLAKWPGELIGVKIAREHSAILYQFRILRSTGQMTEVEVEAATGRIVEIENE